MVDYTETPLGELDDAVRENGDGDAVSELLRRVEEDADQSAALTVDNIARDMPEKLTEYVERISLSLYHAEDTQVRYRLVNALAAIVAEFPERGEEASRGLSDASRIRDDRLSEGDAYHETRVVGTSLRAWVDLADAEGTPVPAEVVENAVLLLELSDSKTVIDVAKLLGRAVQSGSERSVVARNTLIELAEEIDDELVQRHATEALGRSVVTGAITERTDDVQAVLEEYRGVAQDDAVDEAIEQLSGEPPESNRADGYLDKITQMFK